jgi:membrane-bound lytic murein transglycosylase A
MAANMSASASCIKDRGLLGPGQTSMQGIVAWLRANPGAGRA